MSQTYWTNHSNIETLFQAEQNLWNERRFKTVSMLFMALVFGIILGYGWHTYHISLQPKPQNPSQRFIPPSGTGGIPIIQRNYLLKQKAPRG